MKTTVIVIIALAAGFGLAYLVMTNGPAIVAEETSGEIQQYTCGMHPEIVTNQPGYCPICEMKLTPKKKGGDDDGTIRIDPTTSHNMGLVTTTVHRREITKDVHVFGKVTFAEPNLTGINVKFEGWVERLLVDREGDRVSRGQPLFEVYSPQLVAAQKEYLVALQADRNLANLKEAARTRLANWDISEDQIAALESSGEITRTLTVRAPAAGVVVRKKVAEGDRVKPGAELYRIADLSSVWVVAQVYEQDLPFVGEGQTATLSLPNLGGERRTGIVSYVAPFLDSHGQVEIRIEVDNRNLRLKPGMYAEVELTKSLEGARPVIPRSAVINSGTRQLAYRALGDGKYQAREIVTGVIGNNDMVEIRSGLDEGDAVVVSGQFLLDSESRLSEALTAGATMGHDHNDHPPASSSMADTEEIAFDPDEPVATGGHDIHTCPMPSHFHVLQYGQGNCSECNMKLVPLAETDNKQVYVCPMTECGVVREHKGQCPVCGMNLVRYQPEDDHDR